jgi:hypothetical protein
VDIRLRGEHGTHKGQLRYTEYPKGELCGARTAPGSVSEGWSIGSLAICDGQNLERSLARLHRRPQTDEGVLQIRWATAFSTELNLQSMAQGESLAVEQDPELRRNKERKKGRTEWRRHRLKEVHILYLGNRDCGGQFRLRRPIYVRYCIRSLLRVIESFMHPIP